jgi:hypothetical protein
MTKEIKKVVKKAASAVLQKLFPSIVYPANYRIYVVVAATVQNPVEYDLVTFLNTKGENFNRRKLNWVSGVTKSIEQPAGRQFAQGCHAVGRMRDRVLRDFVLACIPSSIHLIVDMLGNQYCQDLTTIVLSVRDSFELFHVEDLCLKNDVQTYPFEDTNPEYGEGRVKTAFATQPIDPAMLIGILDYLPLWEPKNK